ncbi:26S proteasome non-ATPase regulatory subunit 9-like [Leguminivora glycinivorella]|uniref:26S proteasome non-ATPase regulatory subunit 9-like n=1 Tax=Leguminivora glycinivorella TaxID=1035111 RepID=UPI002010052F|nr:26S proteasome non-ATPase regulatory subunit 9-like [Leguminivora glycinivorella]
MVGFNMDGPARDRVLRLMEEKDRLEREIRDHTAVLETNNVGMHDSLVDADGFPRNDIDVYKVRHARHQIICLQNDHKALMRRIEQGLAEVHADLMGSTGEGSAAQALSALHMNGNGTHHNGPDSPMEVDDERQVFARISFVHNGSPADDAGLCVGDEVIQFGSITAQNFNDMSQINDVVSHSVGQRVQVRVRRARLVLNLSVVPRPWAQPGLLGCQINRIS